MNFLNVVNRAELEGRGRRVLKGLGMIEVKKFRELKT